MAGSRRSDEDDDSVLDESEQTMRPPDVALHQQRIQAWHPILDPVWVIVALFYLGVIMVPAGFKIDSLQDEVVELKITYDSHDDPNPPCGINSTFNADLDCYLNFTAPKYMHPPILIHYELTNFHQNHRAYYLSRDDFQLAGRVGNQDTLSEERCEPLNVLGDMTLNPCGLIANTFFNDIFELEEGNDVDGNKLNMIEEGIAWQSDLEYAFNQPEGFEKEVCPEDVGCTAACCDGEDWSCTTPYNNSKGTNADNQCYRFFYPNDDTTQYLHETYPKIISPLEGVTNEHFVVWMRIATQPTFRKLYGWINEPIAEGETLVFKVNANYVVERFQGSKSLIVSTNNIFGGRNPYLGRVLYGVGFFCLLAGTFFALKQTLRPRKLADPAYLHFKTD